MILLSSSQIVWADSRTFTEGFTTTTYKDTTYTTADWNTTQGLLKLPSQVVKVQQMNPDVARDNQGYYYFVWLDLRNGSTYGNIYIRKYNSSGTKQWSSDVRVNVGSLYYLKNGYETQPHIAIDRYNNIYIAWNSYAKAWLQKFNPSGSRLWSSDVQVNINHQAEYTGSDVACDSSGYVYVVFQGMGSDSYLYAQKLNSSGTKLWSAEKSVLRSGTGYQYDPSIVKARNVDYFYVSCRGQYGLFLNSIDTYGNIRWSSNVTLLSGGSTYDKIRLDSDTSNNAICVFTSNMAQVYMQKVNTSGTKLFSSNIALTSTSAQKRNPGVAVDGSNYVYVTWTDIASSSDYNIFAQKFNTSGSKIWTSPVQVDASGKYDSDRSAVVPNYAGGMFLTWHATVFGDANIYGNIITSSATRTFSSDLKINTDINPTQYVSSAVGQSVTIDTVSESVTSATLTATHTLNGQTINYYLSNDGGSNWYQVTSGTQYTFSTQGSDLRWKAVLSTTSTSVTPTVDTIAITYNYTPSSTGTHPYRMYWDTSWIKPLNGFMGSNNGSSVTCDTNYSGTYYTSSTSTKFTYDKTNETWAGIYCLYNGWSGPGINLNGNKRLTFAAKSDVSGVKLKFGMGATSSNDTAGKEVTFTLSTSWKRIDIDLAGLNLSSINGLWYFSIAASDNPSIPNPVTFYVDEVCYDEITAAPIEDVFQDFETSNGTPGAYFYDAWQASPSFESSIVHGGARSVKMNAGSSGGTIGINAASPSGYLDMSSATTFSVWVYDTQGNNTVELKLKDSNGTVGPGQWSAMSSTQNVWTKITWDISGYSGAGLDKSHIASIEFYEWNQSTYYFDDVSFIRTG